MKRIGLMFIAAACSSSSPKQPDAAVRADAPVDSFAYPMPDAPVAAGAHHHYVVDRFLWPATSNESRADGFDLDGDGAIDNQLGQVFSALKGQGFDIQTPTDQSVARGTSITLADLQATSVTNATNAGFTLFAGTNPNPTPCSGAGDTTCGHHLTGIGSFDVAATPRDTPIGGVVTNGEYAGGPGHLSVPLYVLTPMPQSITLLAAHAKVMPTTGGVMQGTIGGAISQADINGKLYPAMQPAFTTTVARDCTNLASPPGCGCAQGSQGATLISLFDTNQNCAISVTEIQQNSLMMSLMQPDVTVENQQALSIGFAFTAVDATFAP